MAEPVPGSAGVRRRLAFGAAVDSFGTGLLLSTSAVYFVAVIGFGVREVGLVMSVAGVAGLLGPVPVGRLADRLGLRRVYCGALLLRGAGYLGYAFVTDFRVFVVATCLLRMLDQSTPPLQQSLVGALAEGGERVRTMALVRSVRNTALSAGFLVAGLALAAHTRPAMMAMLIGNGLSFFVLAAVIASLPIPAPASIASAATAPGGSVPGGSAPAGTAADGSDRSDAGPALERSGPPLRHRRFVLLTVSNGLLLLHDSVLFVLLPVWIVTRTSLPAATVAGLLAVNTVLTVLLQLLFSRSERLTHRPGAVLLAAAGFLVAACAVFPAAAKLSGGWAVAGCAAAVALLTVGENLHAVAGWQLSFDLAPADRRTEYMAVFNLGLGLQNVVGPALMTSVVLGAGPGGWLLLATLFAGSALACRAAGTVRASLPVSQGGISHG
ncbi:MFS transporter [Kitasatospora xanthocidica]|uniref:MFS transporter n=1 Tax=Kitasatospora xanthocidica TaxID=83382 RepID=UPI0036E338E5